MKDKKLFRKSPGPHEFFPFAARVTWKDDNGPKLEALKLYETFSAYNPSAVGIERNQKPPTDKGWVYLPSFEELNLFVDQVNGLQFEDGVWEAVSYYDLSLTKARTATELEEFREPELNAKKEQKLIFRKKKREKKDGDDSDDILQDIWAMGEQEFSFEA
ncbi:hypothetical protein ACO1O0_003988 [Amphichorda felina]